PAKPSRGAAFARRLIAWPAEPRFNGACVRSDPRQSRGEIGMSNLYQCFVCGEMFEFGEAYHGRVVHEWLGRMICNHCETNNWDGIVPEEKLIKRFREAGINEEYN